MKNPFNNKRVLTPGQRKKQHLLDVKIRAGKAREQRNRVLLYWSCMIVLMVGVGGGIVYGVREGFKRFVWENPDYLVKEIEVTDDGKTLERGQIIEASGVKLGVNVFTVNLSKIRQSLLAVPQLETAEVQRVMPNKIVIAVTERQPVAWVATKRDEDATSPGGSFLIDSHGFLFQCKNQLPDYFHLPVIYGVQTGGLDQGQSLGSPEIKAALDLIRLNAADNTIQARFQAIGIDVSKGYCLVVTDRTHARITFGLERIDWQLDRLMSLLDHIEQEKREIQTVNLMVQRNIPVTFAQAEPAPATPAVTQPAKPEKAAVKKSDSKKSQTISKKKAVPVNKPRGQNDHSDQEKSIRKALPVNTSNT